MRHLNHTGCQPNAHKAIALTRERCVRTRTIRERVGEGSQGSRRNRCMDYVGAIEECVRLE